MDEHFQTYQANNSSTFSFEDIKPNEKLIATAEDILVAYDEVKKGFGPVKQPKTSHLKNPKIFNHYLDLLNEVNKIWDIKNQAQFKQHCLEMKEQNFSPNFHRVISKNCFSIFLQRFLNKKLSENIKNQYLLHHLKSKNYRFFNYYLNSKKVSKKTKKILGEHVSKVILKNKILPSRRIIPHLKIDNKLTQFLQENHFYDMSKSERNTKKAILKAKKVKNLLNQEYNTTQVTKEVRTLMANIKQYNGVFNKSLLGRHLMVIGKMLLNRKIFSLSREVYLSTIPLAKEKEDEIKFQMLLSFVFSEKYGDGVNYVTKHSLYQPFEDQPSEIQFWIAKMYGRQGYISKQNSMLQKIIEDHPLSFYSIMASKIIMSSNIKKGCCDYSQQFSQVSQEIHSIRFSKTVYDSLIRMNAWAKAGSEELINLELMYMDSLKNTEISPLLNDKNFSFIKKTKEYLRGIQITALTQNRRYLRSFMRVFRQLSQKKIKLTRPILKALFPSPYKDLVKAHTQTIDYTIFLSLMRQESAFNSSAKSPVGARGLMQLMPKTARSISRGISNKKLIDPSTNIKIGTKYFSKLYYKYEKNLAYTLMAYNAGEKNLQDWRKNIFQSDEMLKTIEMVPFNETRKYVKLIFRNLFFYNFLKSENFDHSKIGKIYNVDLGFKR